MQIGKRKIGLMHSPFIIAEMSGNHNHSLDRAIEIVEAAARAGVHALKLQTYTADTITLNSEYGEFFISDNSSLWKGKTLHELYDQAHTPWEWHKAIFERANELGLICFSSPFDETAVDFLEEINTPAYKIASFENNHLPLLRKVAATGKPIIISTGMATVDEICEAVSTIRGVRGSGDIALLKCTSTYPASPSNSNVLTIPHMRELFGCEVGLSDHTMGVGVPVAAVAHKASIIEKHFTLSRSDGGIDSEFSLEPPELELLVVESKRAWEALGSISYGTTTDNEKKSEVFRRSLYVAKSMNTGDVFTTDNLRIVRPGNGLHPRYYEKILGRKVTRNVQKGEPVSWDIV